MKLIQLLLFAIFVSSFASNTVSMSSADQAPVKKKFNLRRFLFGPSKQESTNNNFKASATQTVHDSHAANQTPSPSTKRMSIKRPTANIFKKMYILAFPVLLGWQIFGHGMFPTLSAYDKIESLKEEGKYLDKAILLHSGKDKISWQNKKDYNEISLNNAEHELNNLQHHPLWLARLGVGMGTFLHEKFFVGKKIEEDPKKNTSRNVRSWFDIENQNINQKPQASTLGDIWNNSWLGGKK